MFAWPAEKLSDPDSNPSDEPREWRLDLNSVTSDPPVGSSDCPSSHPEKCRPFELTDLGYMVCVTRSHQTRNSSTRANATSSFEFKSGRQDGYRTFLHEVSCGTKGIIGYVPSTYGTRWLEVIAKDKVRSNPDLSGGNVVPQLCIWLMLTPSSVF